MKNIVDYHNRKYGYMTGWGLWIMAMAAGLGYGVAWSQLWVENDPAATSINWMQSPQMPHMFLLSFITVGLLDLFVSVTLFRLFFPLHKGWSRTLLISRLVYTLGLFYALYPIFRCLLLRDSIQEQGAEVHAMQLFLSRWSTALIIFGWHLMAVGACFSYAQEQVKWLSYLLYLGGISYILVHGMPLLGESGRYFKTVTEPWLAFPMGISELAMATWMIWAAYKAQRSSRTQPFSNAA